MLFKTPRYFAALAVALVLLAAVACSKQDPAVVSASSVVPLDTTVDWVTYGDHLVVMTVVGEKRTELTEVEKQRGEGTVEREITVRLESPLWTRPTLRKSLELPSTFSTGGGFWIVKNGEESRVQIEDRPWLEVGQKFLALVAYIDPEFHANPDKPVAEANPAWGPLVYLAFDGANRIESAPTSRYAEVSEARRAVAGLTSVEVASLLKVTPADPRAREYMSDDPALRYQKAATK